MSQLISKLIAKAKLIESKEPLIAYFCELYACRLLLGSGKELSQEDKTLAATLLSRLEKGKATFTKEQLQNDFGYDHVHNFAFKVFLIADNEDRTNPTARTAAIFMDAALFLQLLNVFNPLDPEIEEKIKYSKWRAAEILKSIKLNGPSAINPVQESRIHFKEESRSHIKEQEIQEEPRHQEESRHQKESSQESKIETILDDEQDPQILSDAEKYTRFALSAIQYRETTTAIRNLDIARNLLNKIR